MISSLIRAFNLPSSIMKIPLTWATSPLVFRFFEMNNNVYIVCTDGSATYTILSTIDLINIKTEVILPSQYQSNIFNPSFPQYGIIDSPQYLLTGQRATASQYVYDQLYMPVTNFSSNTFTLNPPLIKNTSDTHWCFYDDSNYLVFIDGYFYTSNNLNTLVKSNSRSYRVDGLSSNPVFKNGKYYNSKFEGIPSTLVIYEYSTLNDLLDNLNYTKYTTDLLERVPYDGLVYVMSNQIYAWKDYIINKKSNGNDTNTYLFSKDTINWVSIRQENSIIDKTKYYSIWLHVIYFENYMFSIEEYILPDRILEKTKIYIFDKNLKMVDADTIQEFPKDKNRFNYHYKNGRLLAAKNDFTSKELISIELDLDKYFI